MRKVIVLGYMGCGKSTIGKKLAFEMGVPFFDLDAYIEDKMQLSVRSIFEQYGEIHFRKLEHNFFLELLNAPNDLVIGLGGGTPCYSNNHELFVGENRISIYLKASVGTLFKRLKNEKENRPLIAQKDDEVLREFIATHLFERSYYYNQASLVVSVDGKEIDEVVLEIQNKLA